MSSFALTLREFRKLTIHRLRSIYPKITLRLRAPVEVQNLLPHDIRYRVFDKNLEHNWTSFLRAGGVSPIHVAELSHLLLLSVEVQDTSACSAGTPTDPLHELTPTD